jgi:hypothetical protein
MFIKRSRAIEDGAPPPADLPDFRAPAMIVVIPFVRAGERGSRMAQETTGWSSHWRAAA